MRELEFLVGFNANARQLWISKLNELGKDRKVCDLNANKYKMQGQL